MHLSLHVSVYSAFVRHATFIVFPPFPVGLCVPLQAVCVSTRTFSFIYLFLPLLYHVRALYPCNWVFCSGAYNFYFVSAVYIVSCFTNIFYYFLLESYSGINSIKSPASGASNVSEPRRMPHAGRMRKVVCA